MCPLQLVISDWIGLNPTVHLLNHALDLEGHANLGWSPGNMTLYKGLRVAGKPTLVPRSKP
jgi:hypothetical protein